MAGGGAAGFFAAIECASANPDCQVTILEKSGKVLAKVKVSGGGRCNVTNGTFDATEVDFATAFTSIPRRLRRQSFRLIGEQA